MKKNNIKCFSCGVVLTIEETEIREIERYGNVKMCQGCSSEHDSYNNTFPIK